VEPATCAIVPLRDGAMLARGEKIRVQIRRGSGQLLRRRRIAHLVRAAIGR